MKRYALTFGINEYPNAQLQGCVNDATDWAHLWMKKDFDAVDTYTDNFCIKAAMVDTLKEAVAKLKYRDTLVVNYSGHGSWVPDQSGDEPDGRDEVWVAYDYEDGGLILDDELYEIFGNRKFGSRIVVMSDSCFSGSVGRFVQLARPLSEHRVKPRFLPPANFLSGSELERAKVIQQVTPKGKPRPGAALISGCDDTQYSYDAWFMVNGKERPNGAFTYYAIKTASDHPTLAQWYKVIRQWLPSADYPQSPQLQSTLTQRYWKVS